MERLKWRSFSISSRSYWTAILLPKMKGALDLWKRHGNDCVRASYDEIPKVTQDEVFSGAKTFVKENKGRYECGGYIYSGEGQELG